MRQGEKGTASEFGRCLNKKYAGELEVKMERMFGIIPASSGPYIFILVFSLILIAIIGLFIFIGYSSRHVGFGVSDEGLRISRALYGRFIPRGDVVAEEVKVINLNINSEYKPKRRTNGIGLPGYAEGWFKLKNNEKALMFVTDQASVVYIPTKKDYSVLLSVREAEEFADLIKHWGLGR
jgi:hypothetical protein